MRTAIITAGVLVMGLTACSDDGGTDDAASPAASSASPSAEAGTPVGKANGAEKLAARAILKQARKAADQARSVHLLATSEDANLDMVMTQSASDGKRASGDLTLKTRVVDDTLYIKAPDQYWAEAFNAKKAGKVGKKWVAADLNNPKLRNWKLTTTMGPMMDQFLSPKGAGEVGAVGVQQGQPAVPVTTMVGTVWVATTGKPYPLLISSPPEAPQASQAEFTDWNKKVVIKAPPKSKTVYLAELA